MGRTLGSFVVDGLPHIQGQQDGSRCRDSQTVPPVGAGTSQRCGKRVSCLLTGSSLLMIGVEQRLAWRRVGATAQAESRRGPVGWRRGPWRGEKEDEPSCWMGTRERKQGEERALTKQQGAVLMLRMRRGDPAGAAEPDEKFHLAGKRCSTSKHRLSSTPGTASSRYYARHVGLEA